MSATDVSADIPDGFTRHTRTSPVTEPWEPIYAKVTSDAFILALRLAKPHTNSRGMVHGGLISTLADNAMGLSCGLHIKEPGSRLVTISLSVDFLSSASVGQWLEVATNFVKTGGSICFAQSLVTADGEPCARANATFKIVKPKAA
ncbi:MAG: PaaI family thioesterase [Afipia sp.]|nr:PaaI family thioesterase [Afipia sp.]